MCNDGHAITVASKPLINWESLCETHLEWSDGRRCGAAATGCSMRSFVNGVVVVELVESRHFCDCLKQGLRGVDKGDKESSGGEWENQVLVVSCGVSTRSRCRCCSRWEVHAEHDLFSVTCSR